MADKKLNEVQKVTDMAYVPVIMADGSVGQIAKADLASVVAELIAHKKPIALNIPAGGERDTGFADVGLFVLFDNSTGKYYYCCRRLLSYRRIKFDI